MTLMLKKESAKHFFTKRFRPREKHLTNSVKIDLTDVTDLTIQYMVLKFFAHIRQS